MLIAWVETDPFDIEFTEQAIKERFPGAIVQIFCSPADFVLKMESAQHADVVIMEQMLPLMGHTLVSEEDFDSLFDQFPGFVRGWDHHSGGERLFRWMRSNGSMRMPVIFFTGTDKEYIDGAIFNDPHVFHCVKLEGLQNLLATIGQAVKK